MDIYTCGSQSWKHGGPPKTNVNNFLANHALLSIYFDYFRPFIELKLTHLVICGCS